jgi:hypothetical protein
MISAFDTSTLKVKHLGPAGAEWNGPSEPIERQPSRTADCHARMSSALSRSRSLDRNSGWVSTTRWTPAAHRIPASGIAPPPRF